MKHYIVFDHDCLGRLIWHEFETKSEAESFAEVTQMNFYEYQDKTYDMSKIDKAINKYLNKKKKHIEITEE